MLNELRLHQFRCFQELSLPLGPGNYLFTGPNAAGKTTILEALCVLMRLQSPRVHRMGPMVMVGTQSFGLAGRWDDGTQRQVRYQHQQGRHLTQNGEKGITPADYLSGSGLVVWMGNEDLELVRGSSEGRRRYLDFLCSQIVSGYRHILRRYQRALRARNTLLREPHLRSTELTAYTQLLADYGEQIRTNRRQIVQTLAALAPNIQTQISNQTEKLDLSYLETGTGPIAEALHHSFERERRLGQTLIGPHRDDLTLKLRGMEARHFASEGQQRTLALVLKLTQGHAIYQSTQIWPTYLLDDIFGELDPARREALLTALPSTGQVIMTTTSTQWLPDLADTFTHYLIHEATAHPTTSTTNPNQP